MQLLILTFTYSPNADGVSEASTSMARGLAKMGYKVTVATGIVSSRVAENEFPVVVHEFAVDGGIHWRRGFIGDITTYQGFLLNTKYDVLIAHCLDTWPAMCALPILPRLSAKKILVSHGCSGQIWTIHSSFPWGFFAWMRGLRFVAKMPSLLRQFDQVVFLSSTRDFGRFFDHWLAAKCGLKNITVIPNSVDLDEFDTNTLDFRIQYKITTKQMILCVANYSERKNQELALRCFLQAGLEDCSLVFIGSEINAYGQTVMAEDRRTHGNSRSGPVYFLEKIPRNWVVAAYRSSDLLLLTAKAETQPIVLLEAQAASLPFLSTPTGCVADLAGGKVAAGFSGLSHLLGQLMGDESLRLRLGSEGREASIKTFSRPAVLAAYDHLIQVLTKTLP